LIPLTIDEEIELICIIEQQKLNIFLDTNSILQLGYKFLSDKTKLVFFYMKELANTNSSNLSRPICYASEEYLSIITNSSTKTIKNILLSLKGCDLITEEKDYYIIHEVILESTFKETIDLLLYRKKIVSILSYRITCSNPKLRIEQMYYLIEITQQAKNYPYLRGVYNIYKKRIENIIGSSLTSQNMFDNNKISSDAHHTSLLS